MSTAVINKFGTRFCLILGGIGIIFWILSTLLAVENQVVSAAGVP